MEPISSPLTNLADVLEWSSESVDLWPCSSLTSFTVEKPGPKMIVCHDMKGGYVEDRFVQGCGNGDAYRIHDWYLIDTFIYFSHHFVTIPPPSWISAAHTNATKILGTLITEWSDGAERCAQFLINEETAYRLADQLVAIAHAYRFDGWLINIENAVEHVDVLIKFLARLREKLHGVVPLGMVIWYDSVTRRGTLNWQNELNAENEQYFDACDGIFLNYTWKEDHLQNSKTICARKGRHYDVYVGLDVFGRGCYGGGGFNCRQALDLIQKYDLSVAVFAPGWTHETNESKLCPHLELRFWQQFADFPCERRKLSTLPLQTSFCPGAGQRLFHDGRLVSDMPWFNLCAQQLQPNLAAINPDLELNNGEESVASRLSHCYTDAYYGGGSLKVNFTLNGAMILFVTSTPMPARVGVTFAIKEASGCDVSADDLGLELVMTGEDGIQFGKRMGGDECLGKLTRSTVNNGWLVRSYALETTGAVLRQIQLVTNRVPSSFLLGYMEIGLADSVQPVIRSLQLDCPSLPNVTSRPCDTEQLSSSHDNHVMAPTTVSWTLNNACCAHYFVLMRYVKSQEPLSPLATLLGQVTTGRFTITHFPGGCMDWDAVEITILPRFGNRYSAIFPVAVT